jgi:predicted Zn-ribbon and HTH transcriptional regulator
MHFHIVMHTLPHDLEEEDWADDYEDFEHLSPIAKRKSKRTTTKPKWLRDCVLA